MLKKTYFVAIVSTLVFLVFTPANSLAQPLNSIDEFDTEVHLKLNSCFSGGIGTNLECLERSLERCYDFLQNLGTAGGYYTCSQVAFEEVDAKLNALYQIYLGAADQSDLGAERAQESEEILQTAQRAWVSYRDAMCEVNPSWNRINSGYGAVIEDCMSRLTLMQIDVLSTELGEFLNVNDSEL